MKYRYLLTINLFLLSTILIAQNSYMVYFNEIRANDAGTDNI